MNSTDKTAPKSAQSVDFTPTNNNHIQESYFGKLNRFLGFSSNKTKVETKLDNLENLDNPFSPASPKTPKSRAVKTLPKFDVVNTKGDLETKNELAISKEHSIVMPPLKFESPRPKYPTPSFGESSIAMLKSKIALS